MAKKKAQLDIPTTRSRRQDDEPPLLEEVTQDRRLSGGAHVAVRASLDELAGNPDNRSLGDLEELAASMRVRGQLQAVTVISRRAFLKLKPEHTETIGEEVRFVVLYGNRRLAAARMAGLSVLKIDVATSPANAAELRASALVENLHRKNLDPLEEAQEVAALVDDLGSQAETARQLGMSKGWVSQKLALLNLVPPLKEKLAAGELKVKEARSLGTLSPTEQEDAWERGVYRVNEARSKTSQQPPAPSNVENVPPAPEPDEDSDVPAPAPAPRPEGESSPARTETSPEPVQLTLDLEWGPDETAAQIVSTYGRDRAEKLAAAILERL